MCGWLHCPEQCQSEATSDTLSLWCGIKDARCCNVILVYPVRPKVKEGFHTYESVTCFDAEEGFASSFFLCFCFFVFCAHRIKNWPYEFFHS